MEDINDCKETDPTGKTLNEAGAKADAGKPDCGLLGMFGRALTDVARLATAGADKYSRGGWISVPDGFNRYTGAMGRHYFKEDRQLYDDDPELLKYLDKPILHATQVAWNSLARLELLLIKLEKEENEQHN